MSVFTYQDALNRTPLPTTPIKKYILNREKMDGICRKLKELVDSGATGMANFTLEEMGEAEALELKSAGWTVNRVMNSAMFLSNPPKMHQRGWCVVLPSHGNHIDVDDDKGW
jgi:hypothetical protein